MTAGDYQAEILEAWAQRDDRLRDPHGWLSLAGLWWLHPGDNSFGGDTANEIVLIGDGVPPRAGSFSVADGRVRLLPGDAAVRVAGRTGEPVDLADDQDGMPTLVEVGSLQVHVIRRGERIGLRVRDPGAQALTRFSGVPHFPVDPSWRLTGRFTPASHEIEIVDVTGDAQRQPFPGHVGFEREGRAWRLAAIERYDDGRLWLIFGDATNGHATYGGGRYLVTEPVAGDGSVVADFNLAYNPPCVFSPYATCPLPPAENRLPLPIEAGERLEAGEPGGP